MHYPDDKPISVIIKDVPSPEHVSMPTIDSPSSKKPAPSASLSYSAQKKQLRQEVRAQGLTAPTANSSGRKNWGAQRGEVQGGAANFYKEVKVCGVCAQVYGLLDQSRELLYLEEEKKFEAEKVRSLSDYTDHRDYHVSKDHKVAGHHEHATEVMGEEGGGEKGVMRTRLGRELFSLSLNNPLGLDESTMPPQMDAIDENSEDLETTFLSPVKTKNGKAQFANSMRSPSLPKPRATWKDHVAHDEDIGDFHKEQIDSSSKKKRKDKSSKKAAPKRSGAQQVMAKGNDPHFEVLDDYLKGTKRLQHTVAGRKQVGLLGYIKRFITPRNSEQPSLTHPPSPPRRSLNSAVVRKPRIGSTQNPTGIMRKYLSAIPTRNLRCEQRKLLSPRGTLSTGWRTAQTASR
jgi:hypothetical protein